MFAVSIMFASLRARLGVARLELDGCAASDKNTISEKHASACIDMFDGMIWGKGDQLSTAREMVKAIKWGTLTRNVSSLL